jgi:septal ring-binding cell division protein DamX
LVRDIYARSSPLELTRWGDWWLGFQRDELVTIQLFATNGLERARQLIDQHPGHHLKVISSNRPTAKYLIVQGLFASETEAEAAYRDLPQSLKPAGTKPVFKTIAALR